MANETKRLAEMFKAAPAKPLDQIRVNMSEADLGGKVVQMFANAAAKHERDRKRREDG